MSTSSRRREAGKSRRTPGPWAKASGGFAGTRGVVGRVDGKPVMVADRFRTEADRDLFLAAPDLYVVAVEALIEAGEERDRFIQGEAVYRKRGRQLVPDLSSLDDEAARVLVLIDDRIERLAAALARAEGRS